MLSNEFVEQLMQIRHPYHFTTTRNLESILRHGKILSKNKLKSKNIDFDDLGDLEENNVLFFEEDEILFGRKFTIFDINVIYDSKKVKVDISYEYKILNLRDFIRFYIFTLDTGDRLILPKFIFTKLIGYDSIACIRLKNLKTVSEILEDKNIEYYIIYGHPHRKRPSAFRTFKSFKNYLNMEIPGVDCLREWLKVDKRIRKRMNEFGIYYDMEFRMDYYSTYVDGHTKDIKPDLNQLLASELIIRDEVSLDNLASDVILYGKDESLKDRIEELCMTYGINIEVKFRQIDSFKKKLGIKQEG